MVGTIVKTSCERCGEIDLRPSQLELRVCSTPERSVYAFTCPGCATVVIKPAADPRIITLLRSVGVPSVGWTIPAEYDEPHDGPPLTTDDLIDLMLLLDRPDWLDRLGTQSTSR